MLWRNKRNKTGLALIGKHLHLLLLRISRKEVGSGPPAFLNHRLSCYTRESLISHSFLLCKQQQRVRNFFFQRYACAWARVIEHHVNAHEPDLIVHTETQHTPSSQSTHFIGLRHGMLINRRKTGLWSGVIFISQLQRKQQNCLAAKSRSVLRHKEPKEKVLNEVLQPDIWIV